jgi:hypothetical protein
VEPNLFIGVPTYGGIEYINVRSGGAAVDVKICLQWK